MMDSISDSPEGSKFEVDLKAYFPDIYNLYVYGKQDPKVWEVVYAMLEMKQTTSYGEVTVTYQAGKIQHAWQKKNVVAESRKRLTSSSE